MRRVRGYLALIMVASGGPLTVTPAQKTLDRFDIRIEISEPQRAKVELRLTVRGVSTVAYSRFAGELGPIHETISDCGGKVIAERSSQPEARLFPTFQTNLHSDCAEIRLAYESSRSERIPLLVPDVGLNPASSATIEVHSTIPIRGDSFPRLDWQGNTARRQIRHIPSFVWIRSAEPSLVGAAGIVNLVDGFGWSFYGFFLCAAAFIGMFFLWAHRKARTERNS